MSSGPAAELGARWFGYRPEVAIQAAALFLVLGAMALAMVIDTAPLRTPAFAIAIVIFGAATLLAGILGRTNSDWLLAVPLLDMLALIVMRQLPEEPVQALGYLAILPALWLGLSGRPVFAVLAVVFALGLFQIGDMGVSDDSRLVLERSLVNFLIPTVVAVAAASTYVASRRTAASIRSLTEQQQVTAESLAREKRTSALLDSIVDAVDVGILAYDADGTALISNRTVSEHPVIMSTGLTPLELEQQEFLLQPDRVTPVPAAEGFVTEAIDGKEFRNRVVWISAPGTQQHALSASARPLRDADGAFAGTVVAVEDVTVYFEALLAKNAFVGSVSHEFRTPLASIVGYLELIMDDPDVPDGILDALSVIERNTDRLQKLVSDLIDEASRERGTVKLERERRDIGALCAAVIERCESAADAAGVRLSLDAPVAVTAIVDGRRISQAIENLVSNAMRFTPRGGTVGMRVSSDEDVVCIVVNDSGAGIPPEELEALTSPFYRSTGIGQEFPGVGLGISVTRGIIEAHLGTFALSAEPGKGATATVCLPRG